MNKKLLLLLPAFAMVFSMAGCDRSSKNSSSETASTPTTSTTSQGGSSVTSSETTSQGTSSEGTSQSGSSSEVQTPSEQQVVYSLSIGENNYQFADVTSDKGELDTWISQFKASQLTFAAGAELVVKKDGERIYPGASGDGNNGLYNEETHIITARSAAENADFYLKVYEDGYDSWLSGYTAPVPQPAVYTLTIGENDYDMVDASAGKGELDTWTAQFKAQITHAIAVDDELVVKKDGERIYPGASGDGNNALYHNDDSKALTVRTAADSADFYLKVYDDGYDSWLTGYVAPTPVAKVYTFKLGDAEPANLVKDTEFSLAEHQTAQYKAENVTLTAGQSLVFYEDAVAISEHLASEPEDTTNKNNGVFNAGAITIHNDATANIYFKTWDNGDFTYWVAGYQSDPFKVVGLAAGEHPWAYEDSTIGFVDATKPEEVALHYYKTQLKATFAVAADAEFKVTNGTTWLGGDKLAENGNFNVLNTTDHEGNIQAKAAGSVDLYLKTFTDDSLGLAIVFTPAVIAEDSHVFTYKVNGGEALAFSDEYKLIKNDIDVVIGLEYSIETKRIFTKDEVITFFRDGAAITPGASGIGNNLQVVSEQLKVHNTTAEAETLYVKFYYDDAFHPGNPGYDTWLGGYVSLAPTTLYFEPNENWKQANATFAAYFSDGTWVAATDENHDGVYEIDNSIHGDKVIFVRLKPSTAEGYSTENGGLNWANKWNQTPTTGFHQIPENGKDLATLEPDSWNNGYVTWSTKA